ncbi:MAG TPA: hypothetical protein VGZ22_01535 [Isosphaeraceae bacterium]|nr:hypothetical protein [Isosphaeraceae bacterium]
MKWTVGLKGLAAIGAMVISTAVSGGEIEVENASLPIPFRLPSSSVGEPAALDRQIEASAIEAIGDGKLLLVAHDRSAELFVVETATGQRVGRPLTCSQFPNGAEIPPKWEGMARDDQGCYYVIGTHSGKSDSDRPSRSFLFRFRLTGGTNGTPVAIDGSSVRRWHLADSLKTTLGRELPDAAAVDLRKIEGLTVRTVTGGEGKPGRVELIVGLREPSDLVRAFVADIAQTPENNATLSLTPLFRFDAGSREGVPCQLTSLNYMPEWKGFLIVTATEDDQNVFHGNTLWFLPDEQVARGPRVSPDAVYVFEPAMKAEGLCTLPGASGPNPRSVRLAVSFDNDPHSTHIPSRLQILTISRRAP